MTTEPRTKRIQRKRTKGWKMPDGTVYVGRPTKWGTPFPLSDFSEPEACLAAFEDHLQAQLEAAVLNLDELRGKDLACWCPESSPCHADVLLRYANGRRRPHDAEVAFESEHDQEIADGVYGGAVGPAPDPRGGV